MSDEQQPPDDFGGPAPGVAIGSPATQIGLDLVEGGVRLHFGGEAVAYAILDPNSATAMGVQLIQQAQVAALRMARRRVIAPPGLVS